MTNKTSFGFPFSVNRSGRINATGGDEAIRGKIIQVLFTLPGERIHRPDFGCGLFNMVFEPNNDIYRSAMEFTVGQALNRWLRDDIITDAIQVVSKDEMVTIEIVYTRRSDLVKQAVNIHFK